MSRHIIGLVGRQGSGKGTAAKILAEKYGAQLFRFSAILGDVLDRVAVERTRDNMIKISEALRATFGEDVLAYAIEKDAINSTSDIVVIDGIRRIEDIAALEPLPQFKLVEISAPAKVRYDRMTHRGEKSGENEMTWDEFAEQEQAPTELSIPRSPHVHGKLLIMMDLQKS
jgi:dephospho-CoA kinase